MRLKVTYVTQTLLKSSLDQSMPPTLHALTELRRRGIQCSSLKGGNHMFMVPGQPAEMDAGDLAVMLKLRAR